MKVEMADGTFTTLLVDESQPVERILQKVGEKLGLQEVEKFALWVAPTEGISSSPAPDRSSKKLLKVVPLRVGSSKSGIYIPKGSGRWLDPKLSLGEQGVPDDWGVAFRKKFYVDDWMELNSDSVHIHLLYAQCHRAFLAGDHQLSEAEAYHLAALQCRILWGTHHEIPPSQVCILYRER